MPFIAITTGEITSGEPVSFATQTKIKDNFDDHEARLQIAETASASFAPIILRVGGYYVVTTGVIKTTTNYSLTILGARILVDTAGSSGTVEIDILRKRGVGAFTTIFNTKPSVLYSAGSDALSTNADLNPTMVGLQAGDIFRLDITSAQVNGKGFLVRIDYNRS